MFKKSKVALFRFYAGVLGSIIGGLLYNIQPVQATYILQVLASNNQNYTCKEGVVVLIDTNQNFRADNEEEFACYPKHKVRGSIYSIYLSQEQLVRVEALSN